MPDGNAAPDFGIEEEFLLVDRRSRDVPAQAPPGLRDACREALGTHLAEEMFDCQLELASPVLHSLDEARACLAGQRARLSEVVGRFGMGLLCAGAHPFADGLSKRATPSPHYRQLFDDFRMIARCSLLCGLHVHVGVPPGHDRVRLMNRVLHWLPLLLALSASSPFWLGRPSGSMSYRQAICGQWPRMGLPEALPDEAAFRAYLQWLERTGSVRSRNDIWWVIRPSTRFPTLELRIADACPLLEDALCIAGLFRTLVAGALREPDSPVPVARQVIAENYWRARHLGIHALFLDESAGNGLDAGAWLERMQEEFGDAGDAWAFARARQIVKTGSSADRQLRGYEQAVESGLSGDEALVRIVDGLMEEFGS